MSDHLRLAPNQYAALCCACHPLSLVGSYRTFQHRLASALRSRDVALSRFVASLRLRQVRTLRRHFEKMRAEMEQPTGQAGEQHRITLSFHEWREVSRAFDLARLRDESLDAFRACLAEIAQEQPAFAEKLGRLASGQVALLYMRVKSGKRCCV